MKLYIYVFFIDLLYAPLLKLPSVGPHLQYSGFTAYLYVRITILYCDVCIYDINKVFIFYFMLFKASDSDTHSLFVDIINNPYSILHVQISISHYCTPFGSCRRVTLMVLTMFLIFATTICTTAPITKKIS